VPAVQAAVSAGCNINVTSLFSLARYAAVIDAYQSGLEALAARGGDPSAVHSLASFSLSPVDANVDRRLVRAGSRGARALRGLAATAQAILACKLFEEQFSTERWMRLAGQGATPQRLAWSSAGLDMDMETDGAAEGYLDTLSVPSTVQVLSLSTMTNLNSLGLGVPTSPIDAREAAAVISELAALGIDLDDIAAALEKQSSALAHDSLLDVVNRLYTRRGTR
jgi:transaldolase